MANKTTTTTLNDLTHAGLIEPYLIAALSENPGIWRTAKEFNIINKSTNAALIPSETSWWGAAADAGAGVDTEFDGTEGTDLGNTAVSTGGVTCTAAEYGVSVEVTDNVGEDSIDGIDFIARIEQRMLHVLGLAMEDDFLALFASLSNTIGTTTVDLTIANMLQGQQDLRTRGANIDSMVHVLDNAQAADIEGALTATNAAAAIYAQAADRILHWDPGADAGMGVSGGQRTISTFKGNPVLSTGMTDTANAGADVVGAAYAPTSAYNDNTGHTTFGMCWKRLPRFETDRHAKGRVTDLVMTCRAGFVELLDGSGSNYTSDA